MVVTVSLYDVLIFVLSFAGIILLIYLIIVINNINSILRDVKYIFAKNKNNIDSTISSLPEIASDIKSITGDVREGVKTISSTAETIEKSISKSSVRVVEKTETAVDYVRILSELILTGINYLQKRK